jgi:hypothetical protein
MNDANARLWHPWLRINRVLRVMLQTRWSAEAWSHVRVEFKRALALRSEIRRARVIERESYTAEGNRMTRLLRSATLLVALSLLTSTATAYAECAWVLWQERPALSKRLPSRI